MKRFIRFSYVVIVILLSENLSEANYDYSTGRWLQRDPLGVNPAGGVENPFKTSAQYKNGVNLYEAFHSNPLLNPDPYGLDCGINKYKNEGSFFDAHRGLLIDNEVIDYGPEDIPIFGKCPWGSGPGSRSEVWELKQSKLGILLFGSFFKKPCFCATCGEIQECLRTMCKIYNHLPYIYPIRNCATFTVDAMYSCCLR